METGYLKDFATQLRKEVMDVFSLTEEEATESTFLGLSGTAGWTTALYHAAQKTNHAWLISMYRKLNWFETDLFDLYLIELMPWYGLLHEEQETAPEDPNPYWRNIEHIAETQREKGMRHYGYGLENNPMPAPEVIEYLQEELVDALMYCEHLKAKLDGVQATPLQ